MKTSRATAVGMPWPASGIQMVCCLPAAAVATPVAVAATATAATALLTGTSLVDDEGPAFEFGAVEVLDGLVRAIGHFHEAKAARAAGLAVGNDLGRGHGAVRAEHFAEVILGDAKGKVTDIQFLRHGDPFR